MLFKQHIRVQQNKNSLISPLYKLIYGVANACRYVTNPAYRSRVRYAAKYQNIFHQLSNKTSANRYPRLFEIAKNYFQHHSSISLLSFGCSIGEEVNSLKQYMPNALVTGVDINGWCIAQSKKKFGHLSNVQFFEYNEECWTAKKYNAVFALAVFQDADNRYLPNIQQSVYPFQKFNAAIEQLDSLLELNGLFVIDNTDYNFLLTSVASKYKIASYPYNIKLRHRPHFNRDGTKISDQQNFCRVFIKCSL